MGEWSKICKSACMGMVVGMEGMVRGQLGDRYSKKMGMNKGGSRESKFMGIYVWSGKGVRGLKEQEIFTRMCY